MGETHDETGFLQGDGWGEIAWRGCSVEGQMSFTGYCTQRERGSYAQKGIHHGRSAGLA